MKELAEYDPLLFKFPKGVVAKGTEVEFLLKVSETASLVKVALLVKRDFEDSYSETLMTETHGRKINRGGEKLFSAKVTFDSEGHFWYTFLVQTQSETVFVNKTFHNFSYVSSEKGEDFFQLVTAEDYELDAVSKTAKIKEKGAKNLKRTAKNAQKDDEDILEGGIIYQIMVDRFAKSREPVVREPLIYRPDWGGKIQKNSTDPLIINREVFGGNFEGVTNKLDYLKSLGVTAIYFNPICMANSHHKYDTADYMRVDDMFGSEEEFKHLIESAKKRGIKIIIDGVYNHTGSDSVYFNKQKRFGEGGAFNDIHSPYYDWYEWVRYPNSYGCWWGIDTLPNVRDDSESFRKFIAGEGGVIEKYLKLGVFGLRLDVADEISDELLKLIHDRAKKCNKNAVIIGEVWEDAATKISYSRRRRYFSNNELNSVMNYPVKETILSYLKKRDAIDFVSTIRMIENNYPRKVQHNLMNFLGTHDTSRIMSELINISGGNEDLAKKLLKIAVGLSYTTIGVPSIFYGDDYGMQNNDGSSRGCYDWNNTNFDITQMYKNFAKLRTHSAFKNGDMNFLFYGSGKLVFERVNERERIIVLTNMQDSTLYVNLNGKYESLLSGKPMENAVFELKQYDFEVLKEKA